MNHRVGSVDRKGRCQAGGRYPLILPEHFQPRQLIPLSALRRHYCSKVQLFNLIPSPDAVEEKDTKKKSEAPEKEITKQDTAKSQPAPAVSSDDVDTDEPGKITPIGITMDKLTDRPHLCGWPFSLNVLPDGQMFSRVMIFPLQLLQRVEVTHDHQYLSRRLLFKHR